MIGAGKEFTVTFYQGVDYEVFDLTRDELEYELAHRKIVLSAKNRVKLGLEARGVIPLANGAIAWVNNWSWQKPAI